MPARMHNPDECWCDDDFTGVCPCGCPECQARSVDPAQAAKEEAGARTLLAWIEIIPDHQWKEFEKWLILYGAGSLPYFPLMVSARLTVQYAEWEKMTLAQKLAHEKENLLLAEYERRCAEADDVCVRTKQSAARRYLTMMQRA